MPFDTGRYIIRTKDANAYLLVGPIPLIYPPPEVPVRVGAYPEHWFINDGENGAVTVWTREAETNDYKWIVNDVCQEVLKSFLLSIANTLHRKINFFCLPRLLPVISALNQLVTIWQCEWFDAKVLTNLYVCASIGIPNKDLLLTYDEKASPQVSLYHKLDSFWGYKT